MFPQSRKPENGKCGGGSDLRLSFLLYSIPNSVTQPRMGQERRKCTHNERITKMALGAYNIPKKVMYIRFNPTHTLSNHATYWQVNPKGHKAQQPLLKGEKGKGCQEKLIKMTKDGSGSSHCCPQW